MATRGYANVLRMSRDGLWVLEATPAAMDVLRRAMAQGQTVEVRSTVPTRGKRAKAAKHKLKLATEDDDG